MSDRARGIGPTGRIAPLLNLAVLAVAITTASDLAAQRFPGFGGLEMRGALYGPEGAKIGAGLIGEADLGWWGFPYLRLVAAAYQFSADVEPDPILGGGSYSALGARFGARLTSPALGPVRPHFVASLTATRVNADVADPDRDDELQGLHPGAELGLGFSYTLDADDRFGGVLEVRRTASSGIGRFGVEAGVRYTWLGRDAYVRDPLPVPAPATPQPLASEQQRQDSLRAELERERAAQAEREAAARAEEERRRADLAEVERAAAEARRAVEEERRRQEAIDLQRQAEADARFGTRQAAAEADRRLYESLADLDRDLSGVTAVRGTGRGVTIVLGQGLFGSGQSSLSAAARSDVRRVAALLAQTEGRRIAVEGHTDSSGAAASNQRLSEERAEAVRAALVGGGVDPGRITAAGYGASRPVADNATPAGRAQNRRVEIVLLGMRAPED